jgi:hypothetical protein
MDKKWTKSETSLLIEIFPEISNIELSTKFNRSIKSIVGKANKLGLKKNKSHKSKMLIFRNKILNRDLNSEKLKEIALLYKSRSEFQLLDSSAYQTARNKNILDDICSHMIKQSFSIPQLMLNYILTNLLKSDSLYNTRRIIKPYELDIYFPEFKLAFEYNGKKWHTDDRINKFDICNKYGIKLFVLKENSRKYEEDIKSQLILILEEINIITKISISVEQIKNIIIPNYIFENILDENYLAYICGMYTEYSSFMKDNINLYEKMRKLNLLEKYTSHMKKRKKWNENMALKEVEKYEFLGDLIKNSYGCYLWIKKNNKEYLLNNLKLKQNKILKTNKDRPFI